MSVNYAILGLLSERELSGYDLKKEIQESPYMPWSGNNNQVYRALLQLCEDHLLVNETIHRENAPTKKVYRITEAGKKVLREWVLHMSPGVPEYKKPFLVQLASASQLTTAEIESLMMRYRQAVLAELMTHEERLRRHLLRGEEGVFDMDALLLENGVRSYQAEIEWTDRALIAIKGRAEQEE